MHQSEVRDHQGIIFNLCSILYISINFLSKSVVILDDKINCFLKDLETFVFWI